MSELKRGALVLMLALSLSWCGFRQPGLEVAMDVQVGTGGAAGELDVARIELLPCPDAPASASLFGPSVAYAHDQPTFLGPTTLMMPNGVDAAIVPMLPGSYCDVRVHVGGEGVPALVTDEGEASEREIVIRLLDASGAPTRIVLARPGDHASVHVQLGSITEGASAAHALSNVLETATARVD